MPKLSSSSLRAMLAAEHADSLSASSASKLSNERARALNYYMGDLSKDLPSSPGRSTAVSMDVSDTVEGLMPQLMDVFVGSDEVVRFEPVGPEDVEAAKQETDYVNHVFMNKNPGFMVLYSMIKDALLSKTGICKIWWEKREEEQRETYYDKTDDEFALIASNPEVEIVEHTAHQAGEASQGGSSPDMGANALTAGSPQPALPNGPGIQGPGGQPYAQTLHDVTVVTKKDYSCAKVMPVPPEEFGARRDTRILQDTGYCFHRTPAAVGELIAQGYDEKQLKTLPTFNVFTDPEEMSRDSINEWQGGTSGEVNYASRMVEVTEHYVRMDYEQNGKRKLYRVVTGGPAGTTLILKLNGKEDIQEWDAIPFATITPVPITHRFIGRSIADLVIDIQKIKTALLRSGLDNAYLANNPRVVVSETGASDNTLDDLLVSRPGGIVRAKTTDAIMWQEVPNVGPGLFPWMEYMDATREGRTGVTRQGQGLDANALQNQSATAVNQVFTAAQARIKLIAKIMAETGLRDLFWLLHATIKKHGDKAQVVRLRNNWVTVDPRAWKDRDDLTVSVGLGTGDKATQMAHMVQIAGMQKDLLLNGMTNLCGPTQLFNTAKEMTKLLGKPDTETFFTDPAKQPPPQGQADPKLQIEQLKAQSDMQAIQAKGQLEQQKAQADTQHQIAKTQADIALAEKKFELDRQLKLIDAQIKIQESEHQMALAKTKNTGTVINLDPQKALESHTAKFTDMQNQHAQQAQQIDALIQHNAQLHQTLQHMHAEHTAPAEIIRDQKNKIVGVKKGSRTMTVHRGPDGKAVSIQ